MRDREIERNRAGRAGTETEKEGDKQTNTQTNKQTHTHTLSLASRRGGKWPHPPAFQVTTTCKRPNVWCITVSSNARQQEHLKPKSKSKSKSKSKNNGAT